VPYLDSRISSLAVSYPSHFLSEYLLPYSGPSPYFLATFTVDSFFNFSYSESQTCTSRILCLNLPTIRRRRYREGRLTYSHKPPYLVLQTICIFLHIDQHGKTLHRVCSYRHFHQEMILTLLRLAADLRGIPQTRHCAKVLLLLEISKKQLVSQCGQMLPLG
jgi:hypothetical protein